MKIHFILNQYPVVSENFLYREVEGLAEAGFEIHLLAFRRNPNLNTNAAEGDTFASKTYFAGFFSPSTWLAVAGIAFRKPGFFFLQVGRALRESSYRPKGFIKGLGALIRAGYFLSVTGSDIGHIHAGFASAPTDIARCMALYTSATFSFSGHARDLFVEGGDLKGKVRDALFAVVCTEMGQQQLMENSRPEDAKKIVQINHGLPLNAWPCRPEPTPSPAKTIRLLTVARLEEKKGLIYFIDAAALLLSRGYNVEASIIGEGREREKLEARIRSTGMSSKFQLGGSMPGDEVRKQYREADIMVFSGIVSKDGDRDGLPNVLLEAAAIGIPIVASRVGAVEEMIGHRTEGILAEPGNPEALADAIAELIDQPERALAYVKAARTKLEARFSQKRNIRNLTDTFQKFTSKSEL